MKCNIRKYSFTPKINNINVNLYEIKLPNFYKVLPFIAETRLTEFCPNFVFKISSPFELFNFRKKCATHVSRWPVRKVCCINYGSTAETLNLLRNVNVFLLFSSYYVRYTLKPRRISIYFHKINVIVFRLAKCTGYVISKND